MFSIKMLNFKHIYKARNRAMLSFVLVLAFLIQGLMGASGTCVSMTMSIDDQAQEQGAPDSIVAMPGHEGHDMDMMAGSEKSSGHGHVCPPNGCELCEGKNCSQCSPSQFSAILQQDLIFLKDARLAIPDQAKIIAFIISMRHWSMPPGRAPPQSL